jgi:hypothetical protein
LRTSSSNMELFMAVGTTVSKSQAVLSPSSKNAKRPSSIPVTEVNTWAARCMKLPMNQPAPRPNKLGSEEDRMCPKV